MWHACECGPKSFSDPNNEPAPGFQWRATQLGSASWQEIDISSSAPQSEVIVCAFLIFSNFQGFDMLPFAFVLQHPDPNFLTYPYSFSLSTTLTNVSSHRQSFAAPNWIHKCMETQVYLFQQKIKTADVDKQIQSTVNVVRVRAYLWAYTVYVSMHMHAVCIHRCIQICEIVWVCISEYKGPLRIYIGNANQGTSIRSLITCYIVSQFFVKLCKKIPSVMRNMPTGFYLCQSIFCGLRASGDAPFYHWQNSPSKGCITSSQSLECYVIGKHIGLYILATHSKDDIITKCFSHQILSYHPLWAAPSSSQFELQP